MLHQQQQQQQQKEQKEGRTLVSDISSKTLLSILDGERSNLITHNDVIISEESHSVSIRAHDNFLAEPNVLLPGESVLMKLKKILCISPSSTEEHILVAKGSIELTDFRLLFKGRVISRNPNLRYEQDFQAERGNNSNSSVRQEPPKAHFINQESMQPSQLQNVKHLQISSQKKAQPDAGEKEVTPVATANNVASYSSPVQPSKLLSSRNKPIPPLRPAPVTVSYPPLATIPNITLKKNDSLQIASKAPSKPLRQDKLAIPFSFDLPLLSLCEVRRTGNHQIKSHDLFVSDGYQICSRIYGIFKICVNATSSVGCPSELSSLFASVERLIFPLSPRKVFAYLYYSRLLKSVSDHHYNQPSSASSSLSNGALLARQEQSAHDQLETWLSNHNMKLDIGQEVAKLLHIAGDKWRINYSATYNICATYPQALCIPKAFPDTQLHSVAAFHKDSRIPVIAWSHPSTQAVLLRASSTKSRRGNQANRSEMDEKYIKSICETRGSTSQPSLVIFSDASAKTVGSTFQNGYSAAQGGLNVEMGEAYYYPNCKFELSDPTLSDIKTIKNGFNKLQQLFSCSSNESKYLSAVEESRWLEMVSVNLSVANEILSLLENQNGPHVLVAYEFGCDRTLIICALVKLLADPQYRTLNGFQQLIQVEFHWQGYKFQARHTGIGSDSKTSDDAPVFILFIDCVWQLLLQFPEEFEFNEQFLRVLVEASYSGRFGNFLYNSDKDRSKSGVETDTLSVWSYISVVNSARPAAFCNSTPLNGPSHSRITPTCGIPHLMLWTNFFTHHNIEYDSKLEFLKSERAVKLMEAEFWQLLNEYNALVDKTQGKNQKTHTVELSQQHSTNLCPRIEKIRNYAHAVSLYEIQKGKNSNSNAFSACGQIGTFTSRYRYEQADEEHVEEAESADTEIDSFNSKGSSLTSNSSIIGISNMLQTADVENFNKRIIGFDLLKAVASEIFVPNGVTVTSATCKGYLYKVGGVRKNWKRRWFVLDVEKKCFAYFEDERSEFYPKGLIGLVEMKKVLLNGDYGFSGSGSTGGDAVRALEFQINTDRRVYIMKASNEKIVRCWTSLLFLINPSLKGAQRPSGAHSSTRKNLN